MSDATMQMIHKFSSSLSYTPSPSDRGNGWERTSWGSRTCQSTPSTSLAKAWWPATSEANIVKIRVKIRANRVRGFWRRCVANNKHYQDTFPASHLLGASGLNKYVGGARSNRGCCERGGDRYWWRVVRLSKARASTKSSLCLSHAHLGVTTCGSVSALLILVCETK